MDTQYVVRALRDAESCIRDMQRMMLRKRGKVDGFGTAELAMALEGLAVTLDALAVTVGSGVWDGTLNGPWRGPVPHA